MLGIAQFRVSGQEYTLRTMYFRLDKRFAQQDQDDLGGALTPSEDQRSHPRESTIEKIADIAYDTLRKHEVGWQSDEQDEEVA